MNSNFKIKGPIFIGRSYDEYIKMFNLNLDKLKYSKILDCASGASSFTAEMTKNGYNVQAVDIVYDEKPEILKKRCNHHLDVLVESLSNIQDLFVFNYFKDLKEMKNIREESCETFFKDYKNNKSNYTKSNLLNLPFPDNYFNLVLCSHLLFIYDHRLSYKFHFNAINEMLRVSSSEVRIYPLVKHKAVYSKYVDKIIEDLSLKADINVEKVDYEFRKGANEMMRIIK